ncbi:MAG: class IV adenylate cyclase, partial [Archaeoglobaceae archaeon]
MEVEAKFKLKEGVLEKIERIARFLEEKEEFDLYFSHPCRDFAETDEALRIRVEKKITLTYKGRKVHEEMNTREEVDLLLDDFETAVSLLEFLGFRKYNSIRKKRRIYELTGAIICVDEVERLGKFVEIEVKGLSE